MNFAVLFVCTGNICRSPLAEYLMRARLDSSAPVAVSSAGTMGLTGHGMDAPSALALAELGGDGSGHIARRLTADLVAAGDLILTAESSHRSAIVQADPRTLRRAFTMREFGHLGAGLPPLPVGASIRSLRERVAEVAGRRGISEPPAAGVDEIGDPFGASVKIARSTAQQIADAVDAIIAALGL